MKLQLIQRTLLVLLLVIAGGIVIHTPLTLWLGTVFPAAEMVIKAWKEVLMGVCLVLLIVLAVRKGEINKLLDDRLMQLSLVFAGLHFFMMMVFQNGLDVAGAGLLIDLRFILYFVLVYGFLILYPDYRRHFIIALLGGAVVVIGFAVLQIFVLPKDILASIGYSRETIAPFLTVDENPVFTRINSTLRGPNPLGAYAVIVIGVLTALAVRWRLQRRCWWIAAVVAVATGATLAATHSRSSFIAAFVTFVLVLAVSSTAKIRKRLGIGLAVAGVIAVGLVFVLRDTYFVSNVILHNNATTGAAVDSNTGHAESLADGLQRLATQPFGAGIGSAGSASLIGDQPMIIENYYLFIAHEVGWVGLAIFSWLFVTIMRRLWLRRQSALALGVFASGVGLAIIGILLPVWTDDTVSIVWWGLAAVAIAAPVSVAKPKLKSKKVSKTKKVKK